jgi:hypothetical protein
MMKKTAIYLAAFTLALLVLNGCSNMFLEKPQDRSGGGTVNGTPGEIPEDFGTVTVSLTRGTARTVMPEIELSSLYLTYLFTKDGGTAEEKTPADGKFVLEPGVYSLEVRVFADGAKQDLVAQGTTDANFTVSAGTNTGTVNLSLRPIASGAGTGELEYRLEYPVGVTVETLTLSRIAGAEGPIDLIVGGTGSSTGLSGIRTNIPVGYYLLRAVLKNSGGDSTGRTEVVHIYQNLKARVEYVFIADDFRAYRVNSAADTGPGTLRQALVDALAMTGPQTIQVILEPGTVIELGSALPEITKSLAIEGNGVILTRAASWTASSATSQLLCINTGEVVIRRLHFKDGLATSSGGAIVNYGILTLESCIFSGNRTTSGIGGALYSGNTLTIRGCTFYGNNNGNISTGIVGAVCFEAYGKTMTLTGNLFYGNTASRYPVVLCSNSGTVNASYNVADTAFGTGDTQAGWDAGTGDTTITVLPVSPRSFKLLYGSEAAGKLPAALLEGYPLTDFYGNPISGGGAAGAVQTSTPQGSGYYYLELSVSVSERGNITVSSPPDAEGFYPAGSIITASPAGGYGFAYWLVNGIKTNTAALNLSAHSRVRAVFNWVATVDVFTDGPGPGTLRYALANAAEDDIITFSGITAGTTEIVLQSPLPEISKNLTIEGNGVTLTRAASWTATNTSQLLRITGTTAEVLIRRLHFKNGLTTGSGGAIFNTGILTLESCMFNGNRAAFNDIGYGGAVYSQNTLTIRGCTFYMNTSDYHSGAVDFSAYGKTLTLTGNLFYGNTTVSMSSNPVLTVSGTANASYNVVDVPFGTGETQAGWEAGTGDTTIATLPVSGKSFRLLYESGAAARLPAGLPADYPLIDFYGNPIQGGGAAGAVQASTAHGSGYYYLELSMNNSQRGSVTTSSALDEDGLCPAGAVITASPNSGYSFYWLVNGGEANTAPLSLSAHTWVRAVFGRPITVNNFTDGAGSTPGTLRYALTNIQDDDIITFSGVTPGTTAITLGSALPLITKNLTIEGNSVILTRAASWTAGDSSLLNISAANADAEVLIRRMHFKDGLAVIGGAISNDGILTLESCIFSNNRATGTMGMPVRSGGAIHSENTLTIRGCTFYGNTSAVAGGAVEFWASGKLLTLAGNLFYGNTAPSGPVLNRFQGTVKASYTAVDAVFGIATGQIGWEAGTGDTTITAALPISPLSFRLLSGSEAKARLPAVLPESYPLTEFYGNTIQGGGAAGAVQANTAQGYYLETSVNHSLRGSVTVSSPPDVDGLYPAGSVITANPTSGYYFAYWLVNGVKTTTTTLSLTTHSWVQAVFNGVVTVTDFTDGPGSEAVPTLRYALANAGDGDSITFSGVTPGTTVIVLESALPSITKNLTIEGNGVTLTRAASWAFNSAASQLLRITGETAEVLIRRVYFKDGLTRNYGGAIDNSGILTLESCIFSGSRTDSGSDAVSAYGGAVYSQNTLTIRGCTFYGNTAGSYGGAVFFYDYEKTLTLTGNLFFGNTAPSGYSAVYAYGYIDASYNVVDADFGWEADQSGWPAQTGDTTTSTLPISGKTFKLLYGSPAAARLPAALPEEYPATDFYGNTISGGGAAGAVQASTTHGSGYYYLDLSVNYTQGGSITVSSSPDADGLYPAGSTITASPNSGYSLSYWLVNGVTTGAAPLSLSAHTWVQAVFNRAVTVNIFTDGAGSTPGTLRYALANAQDGDIITFSGVTAGTTAIALGSALPEITKSLTIEGNGVTLTRASSWTANTSSLLRIYDYSHDPEVVIRRVHFKDGRASSAGAISNSETLTLESCIFSGNQATGTTGFGGAISSGNTLTIRGCTFYMNTSSYYCGVIYFEAPRTLTLTGNLFYGNTAPTRPVVVYNAFESSGIINASHNVVDVAYGMGAAQTGWTAGTGDTTFTALGISGDPFNTTTFVPVTALQNVLPATAPADFPLTDFYGATRTFPGAPGAVK